MKGEIEINEQFKAAIEAVKDGKSIFITGKAGTGKSTLLRLIREEFENGMVVLAPTGIAALNVTGQTIHSFFNLPRRVLMPGEMHYANREKQDIMESMKRMVIDEISMVRADVMDGIDTILRNVRKDKRPFGGVQMIMVGDLHQLPPVVTPDDAAKYNETYLSPYAFSARAFREMFVETIALEKIYRQADDRFIGVLNDIRCGRCTPQDLQILNERVGKAPEQGRTYVHLTTTNAIADSVNRMNLDRLKEEPHEYIASIEGRFEESAYPTEYALQLKKGAQVMFVRNDTHDYRWVNGTIGTVEELDEYTIKVRVGEDVFDVGQEQWEKIDYQHIEGKIHATPVGSFTQYPLKLAWAITIHKSQGQTFENVIIDLGRGTFAHGQLYVALSRCTSLEGMILKRPVRKTDLIFDGRVTGFGRIGGALL